MSKNSILRKQKRKQEIKSENKKRKKQKVTDFEFSQFILSMNHMNMVQSLLDTIFHRPFTHERLNRKALRGAKQGEYEIEPGVYLSGKGTE